MCAVAIHAPPIRPAPTIEEAKMAQMPGHWEDEPESVQLEDEETVEAGQSQQAEGPNKDLELFRYNPPAALTELSSIVSETIVLVVRSSVEHVFQQVEAERRTDERGTAPEHHLPNTYDPTQHLQPTTNSTPGSSSTPDITLAHQATINSQSAASFSSGRHGWVDKGHRRHRFQNGIRRMFQNMVEKGESPSSSSFNTSPSFDLSSLPAHIHQISSLAPAVVSSSTTSSFTQLVYKRIKPSSAPTAGSTPEAETIECTSCFDDILPSASVKTPCHHYCKSCFQQLIATALETEAQWPPKCCLNPVPFRTITKHARPDLVQRYRERDEEFKVPAENRIYCSTPDCGTWIRTLDKANKTAHCSAGHVMCLLCRGVPHPLDVACPQDRDRQEVDALAESEGWRRCSKCTVLVEHKEACQHMTCLCGNQFCYVCGAQWKTCVCTSDMLVVMKARAAARRKKEREEDAWLQNALRLIEEYERETREMEERRREERRREERARREAALEGKYRELREMLEKVNEMQKALLSCTQRKEVEEAKVLEEGEKCELARKQEVELQELRVVLDVKLTERELEWDREFRVRVVYEKRVEDEYAAALRAFWSDKQGGPTYAAGEALRVYMAQNDERWDIWSSKRESDLERIRYQNEEEVLICEEIMETKRLRQEHEFGERRAQREARFAAERKWFELVVAERTRILDEIEAVDRESGGVDDEESAEDDELESMSAFFFPDNDDLSQTVGASR